MAMKREALIRLIDNPTGESTKIVSATFSEITRDKIVQILQDCSTYEEAAVFPTSRMCDTCGNPIGAYIYIRNPNTPILTKFGNEFDHFDYRISACCETSMSRDDL